jgi:hypothetical protein
MFSRFSHGISYENKCKIICGASEYCTLAQPRTYILINVTMIWQMLLYFWHFKDRIKTPKKKCNMYTFWATKERQQHSYTRTCSFWLRCILYIEVNSSFQMAFINLSLLFCHFIVFIAHNYHYYFKGDYLYEHLASCCSIDVSVHHSVFMVHMHIYEMNTFLFISMGNVSKCLWWEPGKFVFFSFMNNIPMHGNSVGSTFPWSVLVMPSTDVLNIRETWLYIYCM